MSASSIRQADLSDLDVLVELRVALAQEVRAFEALPGGAALAFKQATRDYLTHALPTPTRRGSFLCVVAVSEDRIVATSGLVFQERPPAPGRLKGREAYVLNMYTRPEARGRGLGARVLAALLEEARRGGAERVWLHSMPEARTLYARAGFQDKDDEMELLLKRPRRS